MSGFLWFVAGFVVGQVFTASFILFWPLIRPDRFHKETNQ